MIAPHSPEAAAVAGKGAAPASAARAIKKLSITTRKEDEREPDKRPLDLGLIARLIGYMRPYAGKRNCCSRWW
jgi:hypothetical protein